MTYISSGFLMTISLFILMIGIACNGSEVQPMENEEVQAEGFADITKTEVSARDNGYNFSVTIKSPDTGCEQYADWWEIINEEEQLLYRRILGHSHIEEQPFTRSGGIVDILSTDNVWIRAHMNNSGYGGKTFFGSVENGFELKEMPEGFGSKLEKENPLPSGCAF